MTSRRNHRTNIHDGCLYHGTSAYCSLDTSHLPAFARPPGSQYAWNYGYGKYIVTLVQADIRNSPFGKQFDLVGMFDVLEHIAEDQETLRLVHNALRLGGKLLLTVPAHQSLWSYFDEAACHCRRYSADGLRQKLEDAGFEVEFLTQFMACLFPIVWAYRKLNGLRGNNKSAQKRTSEEFRLVPVVNRVLAGLLHVEANWVCRGHSLPVGTSLVVVARKVAQTKKFESLDRGHTDGYLTHT